MLEDYTKFINITKDNYSEDIPKYLFGYSLGGLMSVRLTILMENYFKGVILFAPAIFSEESLKQFKIEYYMFKLLKPLNKFFPTFKLMKTKGKFNI